MSDSNDINIKAKIAELKITTYPATITLEKVTDAIELSSDIPYDAKMAVKDFVKENFEEIIKNIDSISNLDVPQEIIEYLPELIEILKVISGG